MDRLCAGVRFRAGAVYYSRQGACDMSFINQSHVERRSGVTRALTAGIAVVAAVLMIGAATTGVLVAQSNARPRIQLRFIGLIEYPDRPRIAVVANGQGTPFAVRAGDIVTGRIRVLRVGISSIDVAYLDGTGRRTIPLGRAR
jgi:hypothetical protein